MKAIAITDAAAGKFNQDQLMTLCKKAGDNSDTISNTIKIMDAFYTSCYVSSSPFLPLVACIIIQFSLQCGCYPESTTAFATFGMLKIFLGGDYTGGQYWADIVREMEKKHKSIQQSSIKLETHSQLILVSIDLELEILIAIFPILTYITSVFQECCCRHLV